MSQKKLFYLRATLFLLFFAGGLCLILWGVLFMSRPGSTAVNAPASAYADTDEDTGSSRSAGFTVDPDDWRLLLVNDAVPVPANFTVETEILYGSHQVDSRILADLRALLTACEKAGYAPLVCSAYRTLAEQTELFDSQTARYISEGHSQKEAAKLADQAVARPNYGEHQLGLAVDIVSEDNQRLDNTQGENPAQLWLMSNSWRYGFILRYPKEKEDATMKMYEPWHYRYVGKDAAKAIYESGLCLEEFLESQPGV